MTYLHSDCRLSLVRAEFSRFQVNMILGVRGLSFDAVIYMLLFTHYKIILYILLFYHLQFSAPSEKFYHVRFVLNVVEMNLKVQSALWDDHRALARVHHPGHWKLLTWAATLFLVNNHIKSKQIIIIK